MPVDEAVSKETLVVALIAPVTVCAPEVKVPVVARFSSPKLMAPVSELMVADFRTAVPVVEAVADTLNMPLSEPRDRIFKLPVLAREEEAVLNKKALAVVNEPVVTVISPLPKVMTVSVPDTFPVKVWLALAPSPMVKLPATEVIAGVKVPVTLRLP